MAALYWLIAFCVFLGLEAASMALTTIWFAGGALAALLLSLIGVPVLVQLLAFTLISLGLLLLTRPLAVRYVNSHTKKTNVDSLIGRHAKVTEQIDDFLETGTAVLNGQEWTARTGTEGQIIEPGTLVTVKEIRGVKLIVEPAEQNN